MPLAARGEVIGALQLLRQDGPRHTVDDLALAAYTDGVTEARDGGRTFDEDGLLSTLRAQAPARAEELVDLVLEAVRRFDDGPGRRDDIALLALRASGRDDPAGHA